MKKRMIIIIVWLVTMATLGIGIPVVSASDTEVMGSQPNKGVIEIQDTGSEELQAVPLHGEWEFYWNQRLEPKDFANHSWTPAYITVPSSWENDPSDEPAHSGHGFGTYRLILHVPASDLGRNKSLFIQSIGSAYRLWIDGEERPGLGIVGSSLEEEQPQSHINLVFFQPKREKLELIIQVSNYSFREGGINREIVYGDTDALIPRILKKLLYDIFIIGGFLMIGLYHLIVCGMRKRDFSTLFVSLVSLAVSMRTLFINGYLSKELLGIESWEALTRLEYMSEIFGFIALVFLMKSLYPREVHKVMMRFAMILSVGLVLFILLTPARVYTESMLLQGALKGAVLLYFIIYVGIKAYLCKREGALIHLAALFLIVCALVNDTLYYLRMVNTVELLSYSIVPFIMAQAVIVSYRYIRLSRRNDTLLEELEAVNLSLEQKVAERTQSLQEANERRTKVLANIAHDLGTPLVGIQTCLQLMIKGKLSNNNNKMTEQLLDKTIYMKRLVDDLFELSKLESHNMDFKFEKVDVRLWFEELFGKFEADLENEGMSLNKQIADSLVGTKSCFVRIDKYRMLQVLQNFMDNAVKFSKGISGVIDLRGSIRLSEGGASYEFVLEVADYGKGIAKEDQAQVFNRFYRSRENNETGSGLGLAIVKEIVRQHQGEVGVRSGQDAGSVFYFILPAASDEA
ncbi:ATP-binding protein [Paenibacillus sp. WQ 127069]|uniref:histidine kinase n=1 Tax=Paenibacillus baimaensis TaxID=2982185 RepID=A0ABT2UDZ1_9BACL|nr:ATP-binding protein [Paenibacillus sp. WQ 127069]MCU6792869.1 ATP-binding protein [Paenibacillus sp. WQ 127069]